MNINFTVKCDTCGDNTNIRFGQSNRDVQPVRFACQTCSSPIDIVLGGPNGGIEGATRLRGMHPFTPEINFVDLHLDFPVSFEPYVMGDTPYMRATRRIGFEAMQLHGARLNHLNEEVAKARVFKLLLKLYANKKLVPFRASLKRNFGHDLVSEKPEDINAAVYLVIAHMMAAFEYPGQSGDASDKFFEVMQEATKANAIKLREFIEGIVESGFLKHLQLDTFEIFPRMLEAELVLRPALFLDFDEGYAANPIPMRVSASEFDEYKDLYKDISEIISRQLVLVAGLNNLLKRGDANSFTSKINAKGKNIAPADLHAFADVPFGLKPDFIDDSWYDVLDGALSNNLRNAIAHYKTEYDEITQLVTYYPKKEGMLQEKGEKIYFLEFVRKLLTAFREMHRLHHLIKCIFYYYFIVLKRGA